MAVVTNCASHKSVPFGESLVMNKAYSLGVNVFFTTLFAMAMRSARPYLYTPALAVGATWITSFAAVTIKTKTPVIKEVSAKIGHDEYKNTKVVSDSKEDMIIISTWSPLSGAASSLTFFFDAIAVYTLMYGFSRIRSLDIPTVGAIGFVSIYLTARTVLDVLDPLVYHRPDPAVHPAQIFGGRFAPPPADGPLVPPAVARGTEEN